MPELPRPRRTADPTSVDRLDDALLEGGELPEQLPLELRGVPELLRAAVGPATEAELTGQEEALAAFSQIVGVSTPTRARRRLRRSAMLSTLVTTKLALAAAASAATLGGATAAAYAGALPAPAQNFAHHTIGAPASSDTDPEEPAVEPTTDEATSDEPTDDEATSTEATATATATPVGPDATGPAAYGLCRAYTASLAHGHTKSPDSVAFQNLATAAGGAENIATYCAGIPHPGSTTHPTAKPTTHPTPAHPTGKPTAHPSHPTHPTHPTNPTHPTGKPTSVPPHATGKPTAPPAH